MVKTLSLRRRLLVVFGGGFVGTLARFLESQMLQSWLGKAWPFDILIINLTGALLLALITVLAEATFLVGPTRRLLLTTGFLGAYTTFSSLALGDISLWRTGAELSAVVYLTTSVFGGLAAILAGGWLGHCFVRLFQRSQQKSVAVQQTEAGSRQALEGKPTGPFESRR